MSTFSLKQIHPRLQPSFYKSPQIRFRQFSLTTLKKPIRRTIQIADNPWLSLKDQQMNYLIDRLQDGPQQLYHTIQKRVNRRLKFKLIDNKEGKENKSLMLSIQKKKKAYEQQFRSLLDHRKSTTLDILLPKLQSIRYVYKDKLHRLKLEKQ